MAGMAGGGNPSSFFIPPYMPSKTLIDSFFSNEPDAQINPEANAIRQFLKQHTKPPVYEAPQSTLSDAQKPRRFITLECLFQEIGEYLFNLGRLIGPKNVGSIIDEPNSGIGENLLDFNRE